MSFTNCLLDAMPTAVDLTDGTDDPLASFCFWEFRCYWFIKVRACSTGTKLRLADPCIKLVCIPGKFCKTSASVSLSFY